MTPTLPTPMHERNHPVTTAPARPTLLGPDGQVLARPAEPESAGDWQPVRTTDNAIVWERPRPVAPLEAVQPVPDIDPLEQARADAAKLLDDARTEAERITAEARSLRARTLGAADHEARTIRETAAAEVADKEKRGRTLDVLAARAVIAGAVGLTAFGEYSLARLAHFPKEVAWLLPFVIDIYVIQAFRRHRDIAQAISLTIAANVVYHLAAAGMFGVTTDTGGGRHATWWLIALVSSIASVILWRMHVMTAPPKQKKRRRSTGTEAAVGAVPSDATAAVLAAPQTGTGTGDDQQERTPVPPSVPAPSTGTEVASVPAVSTGPEPVLKTPSVPALRAVPQPGTKPVPKRRSTGPRGKKRTARGTAPKTGTGTASFEEHVAIARGWLATEPGLSGADIGKRLGTGDSYGRRVKRNATGTDDQPTK